MDSIRKIKLFIMGSEVELVEENDQILIDITSDEHIPFKSLEKFDSKLEIQHLLAQKFNFPDFFEEELLASQSLFFSMGNSLTIDQIGRLMPNFGFSEFSTFYIELLYSQLDTGISATDYLFGLEFEKVLIPTNLEYVISRVYKLELPQVDDEDSFYTNEDMDTCLNFREYAFLITWMQINKSALFMDTESVVSIKLLGGLFQKLYHRYRAYICPLFGDCEEYFESYCIQKTLFELGKFRPILNKKHLNLVFENLSMVTDEHAFLKLECWYGFTPFYHCFLDFKNFQVPWDLTMIHSIGITNKIIKQRLFEGAAYYEKRTDLFMPFEEFCFFVNCLDFNHPTAKKYWFRILDLDSDDILSLYELDLIMYKPFSRARFIDLFGKTFMVQQDLTSHLLEEIIQQEPSNEYNLYDELETMALV